MIARWGKHSETVTNRSVNDDRMFKRNEVESYLEWVSWKCINDVFGVKLLTTKCSASLGRQLPAKMLQ
jgi:hypothetical protein